MIVEWLSVENYRNHRSSKLILDSRCTLVVGPNGQGKTNLLEALSLLSGSGSFRGAVAETLVRAGCAQAYVRAQVRQHRRTRLVELEIAAAGRSRAQVNGQRVRSLHDLADVVSVVVFCPDDLAIPAGGPAVRRALLDEVLTGTDRNYRSMRLDFERILRQRNNLLKQAGHQPDGDAVRTLDVWDTQMASVGEAIAQRRERLCTSLLPPALDAYCRLAGTAADLQVTYDAPWRAESLAAALTRARPDDLRRGTTTVGPHRDDVTICLDGLPARTHASQGEQRSIALALRLAQHRYTAQTSGVEPVILLDDVFSELDSRRAERLAGCLPPSQTVVTSATGHVPSGLEACRQVQVRRGEVM
ncbi:DNA replication/repair protein RecF [Candidatus Poriferisodalis sp.]|uniref:DNA replication/repair protein RecF n=1 Tax=Candidatus Poriferisodalis sp. TaxID=3101277 RepID=UPI003B029168